MLNSVPSIFFVRCFLSLTLPWLFRLIIYIVMSWYKELTFMPFISKEMLDKAICLTITSILFNESYVNEEYVHEVTRIGIWFGEDFLLVNIVNQIWNNMALFSDWTPQHLPIRIDLIDFLKHLNIKPTINWNSVAPKTIH